VEFGLRCACLGLSGVYVPEAQAWHHGSATLGRWHHDTVRRISRNQVFLVARHYPASFAWHIAVAQLLWGALAARHGAAWPWFRGKWEGLSRFPVIRANRPPCREKLAAVIRQSEREIAFLQQATGWDRYWKWYFRLTRGGAK
jgi:GT2 family glycosyltransferase